MTKYYKPGIEPAYLEWWDGTTWLHHSTHKSLEDAVLVEADVLRKPGYDHEPSNWKVTKGE